MNKQFETTPMCDKCIGVDTEFAIKDVKGSEPDTILVICQRCGYFWFMDTADAGEKT